MKKIKVRQLGIAAILLLCAVFCQAQRQLDTIRVMVLVCDTTKEKVQYCCEEDTLQDNLGGNTIILKTGYKNVYDYNVYWRFGYSVREKHNTIEGVIDPYFYHGVKYEDYWVHLFYLNYKKERFPSTVVVWQSVSAK